MQNENDASSSIDFNVIGTATSIELQKSMDITI